MKIVSTYTEIKPSHHVWCLPGKPESRQGTELHDLWPSTREKKQRKVGKAKLLTCLCYVTSALEVYQAADSRLVLAIFLIAWWGGSLPVGFGMRAALPHGLDSTIRVGKCHVPHTHMHARTHTHACRQAGRQAQRHTHGLVVLFQVGQILSHEEHMHTSMHIPCTHDAGTPNKRFVFFTFINQRIPHNVLSISL